MVRKSIAESTDIWGAHKTTGSLSWLHSKIAGRPRWGTVGGGRRGRGMSLNQAFHSNSSWTNPIADVYRPSSVHPGFPLFAGLSGDPLAKQ